MVGTGRGRAAAARAGDRPLRVLLACSGLGHVARGFETFAIECHRVLGRERALGTRLVWAAGEPSGPSEAVAPALRRGSRAARALGRLARRDGYFAEQMTYAARLVPLLARERPDVVYVSDWALAGALGRLRAVSGLGYRLLLSNGAPGPPPYDWTIDHVQHLTPRFYDLALELGEPSERHTLLPLGVAMPARRAPRSADERAALRRRLGLTVDGPVVLSVAALNAWSKRLDYVVHELAALERPPHLVMLGQPEAETPALLGLARDLLGPNGFTVRTVPAEQIGEWYRAADVLVLGSIFEAQARVLPEAMAQGLPVVAHDAHWSRWAAGGHAALADLERPGALRAALAALLAAPPSEAVLDAAHAFAYERFSWDRLVPRYLDMLRRCSALVPRRLKRPTRR